MGFFSDLFGLPDGEDDEAHPSHSSWFGGWVDDDPNIKPGTTSSWWRTDDGHEAHVEKRDDGGWGAWIDDEYVGRGRDRGQAKGVIRSIIRAWREG